ncbi:MAG TPA: phycobiliprotein lyase [Kamptonema sp.]|nr:phycobiliprotein lyase [Kamptonema sp.]
MDIIEFFEQSAGKWFSQRTLHNLTSGQLQAGKSELKIEILPPSDPAAIELCSEHAIAPTSAALTGVRITWNGSADNNQKDGSTVIVFVPNSDNPKTGKLLQSRSGGVPKNRLGKLPAGIAGSYTISDDDVLTLITQTEEFDAEERLWYLMPNLRVRTSVVKRSSGMTIASFCSEIRMGVTKPAAQTAIA